MIDINLELEDIEILKQKALDFPKETIKLIKRQLSSDLEQQYFSKAYYLMALSYKSLKKPEDECISLNIALSKVLDVEEKLRILVRRAGFYTDNSLYINAFEDLTAAQELYETSLFHNLDIVLSIHFSFCYLYMTCSMLFQAVQLWTKIDKYISICENIYLIAHYFKLKALYSFQIRDYNNTINYLNLARDYFKKISKNSEIAYLYPFYAICQYKLNDKSYLFYKVKHETILNESQDIMETLRYLVILTNEEINPIDFFIMPASRFLNIIEFSIHKKDYKTASILYSYLGQKHEKLKQYDVAISFFKKQSEYNTWALRDDSDYKLIELHIHFELQKLLRANKNYTQSEEFDENSPSIIKNYVRTQISTHYVHESNSDNYRVMSGLLINQFKTQISICTNYGIKFIETNQIQALESDGNYTILYDQNQKRHISSKPLAYYEKQLDPTIFLRTHRSYIVNKNFIKHFYPGRVGKLELKNGQTIEISARKMAEVRKKILF